MTALQKARAALAAAARRNPTAPPEDLLEWAADILDDWECDAAHDREVFGEPEDTPALQSADLWGTGEGRYHGIIGG